MGTRGLWSVFFRGRYYIYYNHFDSYPEGLGQILIDQIPVEAEELQCEYLRSLLSKAPVYPAGC
jgi:hypothetical protein